MANDDSTDSDELLHGTGIYAADPADMFVPAAVLSDEHDFGVVVSASVRRDYVERIGFANVSIRMLSVSDDEAEALRSVVARVKTRVSSAQVLRYVGVWRRASETWLVSERRPQQLSAGALFEHVQLADAESIVAHVLQRTLCCLRELHQQLLAPHLSLTPRNIFICHGDAAAVCVGDVGVYPVLAASLRRRRSCAGAKLWPLPRELSPSRTRRAALHAHDVWDVGVCVLTLLDGGAALVADRRAGRRTPRLPSASRRSAQLNGLVALLFDHERVGGGGSSSGVPTCAELLAHRFVAGASPSACAAAVRAYFERCADFVGEPLQHDVISALRLRADVAVQAPLICIDDYCTDLFSCEQWSGAERERPTVELCLARMLESCKLTPLGVDAERNKALQRTARSMRTFLDTADAQWHAR